MDSALSPLWPVRRLQYFSEPSYTRVCLWSSLPGGGGTLRGMNGMVEEGQSSGVELGLGDVEVVTDGARSHGVAAGQQRAPQAGLRHPSPPVTPSISVACHSDECSMPSKVPPWRASDRSPLRGAACARARAVAAPR